MKCKKIKTIKVIARSLFHDNLEESFVLPAKEGVYFRRVRFRDSDDCLCGWPVCRTNWYAPEGWDAYPSMLFSPLRSGKIAINLRKKDML